MGSNPIARSCFPDVADVRWLQQQSYVISYVFLWRRGQVVRQRSAKPLSPVRIRSTPQHKKSERVLVRFFCLPGYCFSRQLIHAFIIFMPGMAFDPMPFDLVGLDSFI